jgi:uncharacterized RDD family membrane protein YckC
MTETIVPATPAAASEGPDLSKWAYAGFWLRFFALMTDFIVLVSLLIFIIVPLEFAIGLGQIITWPISAAVIGVQADLVIFGGMKIQILGWLYFALLESSSWQATVGKKLFGLTVMTTEGAPLSFGRATGRYFAKYLSVAIWCLGFVLAAFTAKKQALHDIIAETLVMRKAA